jgi:hypothetical protein
MFLVSGDSGQERRMLYFVMVTLTLFKYSSWPNGPFGTTTPSAVPVNTALKVSVCPFIIVVPTPGVVCRVFPLVIVEPPTDAGTSIQVISKVPQE